MKSTGIKGRPASKHTLCKRPNLSNVRAMSVPVDRKENIGYSRDNNISTQSSTLSATAGLTRNFGRTSSRTKGLALRGRVKRENSRIKPRPLGQDPTHHAPKKSPAPNVVPIKVKSDLQINKVESPKRIKVSSSFHRAETGTDRYKLKEICFVKQNLTKKVIAKFNKDSGPSEYDDDEDLVVAWDKDYNPRIMTVADKSDCSSKGGFKVSEPSTSAKVPTRGSLKNSSFMVNKIKRPKNSLRRLASANIESAGKVEKLKKRKKLKSKII